MPGERMCVCVNGWTGKLGEFRNTYGDERAGHLGASHGQGAIPDFLDLLADGGEGEDAGLGHSAIGAVRRQTMADLRCTAGRLTFGRYWWL